MDLLQKNLGRGCHLQEHALVEHEPTVKLYATKPTPPARGTTKGVLQDT